MNNEINISFKELIEYIREKDFENEALRNKVEYFKKKNIRYKLLIDKIKYKFEVYDNFIPKEVKDAFIDLIENFDIKELIKDD